MRFKYFVLESSGVENMGTLLFRK